MKGWLLDTNVLSELRRRQPNPRVRAFVARQRLESLFVSDVTFAEIRFGIELVNDPQKRTQLADWLDMQLRPMFKHRTLAISEDVMLRWRLMVEAGRKTGKTFPQPDLIIAATAMRHGLTVVSRDVGGYEGTEVSLFNPWLTE